MTVQISRRLLERTGFLAVIGLLVLGIVFSDSACDADPCPTPNESFAKPLEQHVEAVLEESSASDSSEIRPQAVYVDMENVHFAPATVEIPVDTTLVFTNKEKATAHKVYETKGLFYGPRMLPGEQWNYTATVPGNFTVYSVIGKDAGMKMRLIVS